MNIADFPHYPECSEPGNPFACPRCRTGGMASLDEPAPKRKGRTIPPHIREVLARYRAGATIAELMKTYNMSYLRIKEILRDERERHRGILP